MARDWCNEKDPANKKVLDFIRKHLEDTKEIADELSVSAEWILGLAGTESEYGESNIARNAQNFFGQAPGASGNSGVYVTKKGAKVSKFRDYGASASSFARDFGRLVRGKRTAREFVDALVPGFNTADPKTNGNPKFKKETLGGINSIINRMHCLQSKPSIKAHKCGAKCKDFKQYGYCDRLTTRKRCWQHSL